MTSEQRSIVLPDGRRMSYAEYGAPGGRPLMFFPGTPGSHLLASLADEAARALAIRLIAPERPGIGRSDDQPGRRFADWPADVARLADALECQRFGVLGVSGGGPYALACAARLPQRVDAVGLVSSPGPYDVAGAFTGMALPLRLGWSVVARAPWLSDAALRAGGPGLVHYPDQAVALLSRIGAPADREVLARADFRALFRRDARETLRQGTQGVGADFKLYAGRWDISLAAIAQRVHLWHGDADRIIPVAQARYLARTLPDCVAVFVAGAGHFWFVDHLDSVLGTLFAADV